MHNLLHLLRLVAKLTRFLSEFLAGCEVIMARCVPSDASAKQNADDRPNRCFHRALPPAFDMEARFFRRAWREMPRGDAPARYQSEEGPHRSRKSARRVRSVWR